MTKHNEEVEKHSVSVNEGANLLDAINEVGIPNISVFGVCDKQLACHSCAVHIVDKYNVLDKPSEEEIDVHCELGDLYRENSTRMSCQIKVRKEMEGMQIEIPRSAFFFMNQDEERDSSISNKICGNSNSANKKLN